MSLSTPNRKNLNVVTWLTKERNYSLFLLLGDTPFHYTQNVFIITIILKNLLKMIQISPNIFGLGNENGSMNLHNCKLGTRTTIMVTQIIQSEWIPLIFFDWDYLKSLEYGVFKMNRITDVYFFVFLIATINTQYNL